MTTITFHIPDKEIDSITQIINKKGGTLFVTTKDKLSKEEQTSLNRALDEVQKINSGEIRPLNFDDLWDK